MPKLNSFENHEEFSQRYLKPLLVDPLEVRLNALPDYTQALPAGAIVGHDGVVNEKTGGSGTMPARFIRTPVGWTYRHHILLEWQQPGDVTHARESEQDLQYSVTVSQQPDMAGVSRLTVDLHGSLMRYERDVVTQEISDGQSSDLGKGWARTTLQWSLRLQLVVGTGGRVNVVSRARKSPAVTDAGKAGAYIVSDPLAHLLNLPRLMHGWEHGNASLAAVQDYLVSRLAAAIEPVLANHEHV